MQENWPCHLHSAFVKGSRISLDCELAVWFRKFQTPLRAESEEEPKNLLMRVKEGSEKAALKLNNKKKS